MSKAKLSESDLELLKKYNKPGPRYTSYPTAPEWSDDFNQDDYVKHLKSLNKQKGEQPLSVYIHIPFCEERCYYCGCFTMVDKKRTHLEAYLEHLEKEIELFKSYLPNKKLVSQLHWGGGTPTFLDEKEISRVFDVIDRNFVFEKDCEVAVEIDPCVTPKEKLKHLRDLGFNRISIGVQDLNPDVQKAVNRVQSEEMTFGLIDYARELGFLSVNMDFIYGLPLQTLDTFRDTIEKSIRIGSPDRVALFSYAKVPWMSPHQKKIKDNELPNTDEKFAIFLEARNQFLEAGYVAIGMDHFAKPDDEISIALKKKELHRNFMGYTVKSTDNYIGFGASSIGYVDHAYVQNKKVIKEYYNDVNNGLLPIERGLKLNKDDLIRQWTISSLMCHFEVDYKKFNDKFGENFSQYFSEELSMLDVFIQDDFLDINSNSVVVKGRGTLFVRNIAMEFDKYLRNKQEQRRFSQTV